MELTFSVLIGLIAMGKAVVLESLSDAHHSNCSSILAAGTKITSSWNTLILDTCP